MATESISVHVNRSGPGSVAVEPATIETGRSFALRIRNHGEPTHVHCRVTGELADAATVDEPNPYVDADGEVAVRVQVTAHDGPVSGEVECSTRFGANSAAVGVTLTGGVGERRSVDVDERLAEPRRPQPDDAGPDATLFERLPPGTLGVAALATIALSTALATAVLVGGTAAVVGVGVVFCGIVVAAVLLRR